MAYVVAEPCIKCKYTECVSVCPVDCFREGANFLAIDPDECISCGACEPVCPTKAIFEDSELPDKWADYADINAKYGKVWPQITKQKAPLAEAEQFKDIEDKRALLDPAAGG